MQFPDGANHRHTVTGTHHNGAQGIGSHDSGDMFSCSEVTAITDAISPDPRIKREYLRCIPGINTRGTVLLVGVVHDHPASIGRVEAILATLQPEVLALELPPLAMPLFREYAAGDFVPPRLGGEMSTAIQAGGAVRTVGIDAPNLAYLRRLFTKFRTGAAPLELLFPLGRDLASSVLHTAATLLAALVGSVTSVRIKVYVHSVYGATLLDSPDAQATDEAAHLSKQQAFIRAVERPIVRRLIDETREDAMVEAIQRLRCEGDVIAVVGMEHLDPIADRLSEA